MRLLTPPARLTPTKWADAHRVLSPEGSAKPGRFRSSSAPYQVDPLNAIVDPTVHTVVLMWASQTGKTEGINNTVCFFIDAEPAPILMVQPTVELAESWSKERLDPMIRDTPRLREKVKDPRSRDSGNTILRKTFPGGNIAIVGANAPAGLAGRPRRVVLLDEVDRYPASAKEEGDPCALAIRRTESFWNAIVVMTSTPTVKGASRIEAEFEDTDKRRWFVRCPLCEHEQTLQWSQVQWDDGQPETARYVCSGCEAQLDDAQRIEMVKSGQWIATAPFKGKAGFHLNGIASLFRHKRGFVSRLHQMAADYIAAKRGGKETLKTWTNTFLAETWAQESIKVEEAGLLARREDYRTLPNEALVLTCGVDVQAMRIEATVYAWGLGEESWCVTHRIIGGRYNTNEPWKGLDALLSETWKREDGVPLRIVRCMVDSGKWPDHVTKQTKKRTARGVFAIKGGSTPGLPVIGKQTKVGVINAPHYRLGVDTAKGIIMSRLAQEEPGPGFIHFTRTPDGNQGEEFFLGLTAEEAHPVKRRGFSYNEWHLREGRRNEPLDCAVYALAALYQLKPDWVRLAQNMDAKAGEQEPPETNSDQPAVAPSAHATDGSVARTYELRPHTEPAKPDPAPAPAEPKPEAKPQARVFRFRRRGPGWRI